MSNLYFGLRMQKKNPGIDTNYLTKFLVDMLNIASPTGLHNQRSLLWKNNFLSLSNWNYHTCVKVHWLESKSKKMISRWLPQTAHVDKLEVVMKEIKKWTAPVIRCLPWELV